MARARDLLREDAEGRGDGVVVQRYLTRPLLVHGRKFDIRQWLLVSHVQPLRVFAFGEPYLRFCAAPYREDGGDEEGGGDLYMHLSNNSVQRHGPGYRSFDEAPELMWTATQFRRHLQCVPVPCPRVCVCVRALAPPPRALCLWPGAPSSPRALSPSRSLPHPVPRTRAVRARGRTRGPTTCSRASGRWQCRHVAPCAAAWRRVRCGHRPPRLPDRVADAAAGGDRRDVARWGCRARLSGWAWTFWWTRPLGFTYWR